MPALLIGCQAAVAVAFAGSALAKVAGRAAYADFRRWLARTVRVPAWAAPLAVAAEAGTAVAVLVPATAAFGFGAALALLAVFTAALASMIRRRVRVPCRCFGAGRRPPGPVQVARNGALALVAAVGGVSAAAGAEIVWTAAVAPPVAAGAALGLLLAELEEIVELAR
ncbi:MauE/DoxX family redox-associated membrane protein [Actinomadura kijaniata]|uniref:MauE/DoxX family redox-associated membrane protein n=1 Tax=Actinomadura kijaniata TaxID=46161 RepID=UPI000832A9C9|nr:MauE/DoxX family redox-associated membrane protein [Actinomadura kijaniata]